MCPDNKMREMFIPFIFIKFVFKYFHIYILQLKRNLIEYKHVYQ